MRNIPGNVMISLGLLLLSSAILLEDFGLPHGVKLFLMGLACALELLGTAKKCKDKKQ